MQLKNCLPCYGGSHCERDFDRLLKACEAIRKDILLRADIDDDGVSCVNVSYSQWREFNEALDHKIVANEMAKKQTYQLG